MTPSAETRPTLEQWRQRLLVAAPRISSGALPVEFFRRLSLATRNVWQTHGELIRAIPALNERATTALAQTQLVSEALSGLLDPIDPMALADLIADSLEMVAGLELQGRAIVQRHQQARVVSDTLEQLASGQHRSLRPLLQLAEEALSHPCAALDIACTRAEELEAAGLRSAGNLAQALETAEVLARWLPGETMTIRRQRFLAAWLQDLGGWRAASQRPLAQVVQEGPRRLPPHHPATGAAMLLGLDDAPAELSLLVGAHHERCDGSGFPQHLRDPRVPTAALELALAVRWSELTLDPLTTQLVHETGWPRAVVAGVRLWPEVRRGAFPQSLVRERLELIQPGLVDQVAARASERLQRFVDRPHRTVPTPHTPTTGQRLEVDHGQQGVAAPAFLRRMRRQGLAARTGRGG